MFAMPYKKRHLHERRHSVRHTSVVGTPQSCFSKEEGCAAGVLMKSMSFARWPLVAAIFAVAGMP